MMHVSRHRTIRPRTLVATATAGDAKVRASELATTRRAIAALPKADRALLRQHGLHVTLVPKQSLEDGMLGATSIVRDGERWAPTTIRIASRITGRGSESLAEVVQHEIGHAISVLREQDRSEDAAERYARKH